MNISLICLHIFFVVGIQIIRNLGQAKHFFAIMVTYCQIVKLLRVTQSHLLYAISSTYDAFSSITCIIAIYKFSFQVR